MGQSSYLAELRKALNLKQYLFQPNKATYLARKSLVIPMLLGTTIAVGTIALTSYQILRGIILEEVKNRVLLEVRRGTDEIDEWLKVRFSEVTMLANTTTVRSLNGSVAKPYLQAEVKQIGEFHNLLIADTDGLWLTSLVTNANINIKDRDYFQKARMGNPSISDPFMGRATKFSLIAIATPIRQNYNPHSPIIGVFIGSLKVDRVTQVVNTLRYGSDSYAFAINSTGQAIVHPNRQLLSTQDQPAASLVDNPDSTLAATAKKMVSRNYGIELIPIDGTYKYVAYMPLQKAKWSVALVIPRENIESHLQPLNLLASILGGLLAIAMIGVWRQVQLSQKMRYQVKLLSEKEKALRQAEKRNQAFLQAIPDMMFRVNSEGVYLDFIVTERHELTVPPSEIIGINVTDALPPEISNQILDCINLAIATGETQVFEYQLLMGDLRHYEARLVKIDTDEVFAIVRDISDRKIAEIQLKQQAQELAAALLQLQRTQSQLIQSEKMSSLGQMVAGVAHEINNPVNFIHGNLLHAQEYTQDLLRIVQLYQQHYPNPPAEIEEELDEIELDFLIEDLTKLLKSMKVGTERIREIVKSLRLFSRLDEAEIKEVDIQDGIDSTLMILHNRLKAKAQHPEIQIIKEYSQLPLVECNPGQLNQVFMNILSNAIDALDEYNKHRTFDQINRHPSTITISTSLLQNNWVRISIADNGGGMTEAVLSKLFDPFFTTKPVGKGTGLGLSISYQIVVDKHGGKLMCHSAPGEGAAFTIEIPIRQQSGELKTITNLDADINRCKVLI